MRDLFGRDGLLGSSPKLEYQVTALIAGVACAAFIGRGYPEPALSPLQPIAVLDSKAGADLFEANFSDEGFRSRPASPAEFAAVYGVAADRPYTALTAAEWSAPTQMARKADEAPAAKLHRKPTLVAQACSGECGLGPASITAAIVTPPPRPADLTIMAQASAPSEEKRVRLLGMSLPGFIPTSEKIAKTVVSWGGSIAGVIPGL
jgi:hypothetical protein